MEQNPVVADTETQDQPVSEPSQDQSADTANEVEKWKALARKHEGQAKANADAAKRLAELEDAQKSEAQRLEERAAAAERERDEVRVELTRLRMATRYGIAEDDLDLLGSGSDEEIESRAKRLAERFAATPAATVPGKPTESMRSLKSGSTGEEPSTDGNDWFRRFAGSRA